MTIVMAKGRALRELVLAEAPNRAAIRKASTDAGNSVVETEVQSYALAKDARSILTAEQLERFKEMRQHR